MRRGAACERHDVIVSLCLLNYPSRRHVLSFHASDGLSIFIDCLRNVDIDILMDSIQTSIPVHVPWILKLMWTT